MNLGVKLRSAVPRNFLRFHMIRLLSRSLQDIDVVVENIWYAAAEIVDSEEIGKRVTSDPAEKCAKLGETNWYD